MKTVAKQLHFVNSMGGLKLITAIEYAIGRQLSAIDRRPLGIIVLQPGEKAYDGGFCEKVMNEAIDATLINDRHKALWAKKDKEGA